MAVLALTWKKTRSTTTAWGRSSSTSARSSVCRISRRSARGASGSVSTTPAACARRLDVPSERATSPYPQRESPGSMPNANMRS